MLRRTRQWPSLPSSSSGVPTELGVARPCPRRARAWAVAARSSWWGSPASARPACWPSSGAAPTRQGQLVLSGSASELERELPFWVFVDALDEYVQGLEPRRLDSLDEDALAELAHVLPSLSARGEGNGARGRTSAIARIAPFASCWSSWRRPSRWCCCSTTCTGPTRDRSSCSARCSAVRRLPRC